jgi:hypothetical protein
VGEERRRPEIAEMCRARLVRATRRVERIRQEQQRVGHLRLLGRRHARLTSAVGLPADGHPAREQLAEHMRSSDQSGPVARRASGMRWPAPANLTIRKIASQDGEPPGGKRLGEGDEERRRAIAACAMREDETAGRGGRRTMEKSANGRLTGRGVLERLARRR